MASTSALATTPLAYVSNERDGTIMVINTATDRVIDTIRLGGRLRGIHISPDGRRLYVALSHPLHEQSTGREGIVAIDLSTRRVIDTFAAGSDPENFAIAADGRRLYI